MQINNIYNIPFPPKKGKKNNILENNSFCVIDIETTGLNPKYDKIIQIACKKISNGIIDKPFSSYVDPEVIIPPLISAITGINNALIKKEKAPTLNEITFDIKEYIGDSICVAHNASFDRAFVNPYIFKENGYTQKKWFESPNDIILKNELNGIGREWLCTYRLGWHCYKSHKGFGYTDMSLSNESLLFWLEPNRIRKNAPHNAINDVNTTLRNLIYELNYAENFLNLNSIEEIILLQNMPLLLDNKMPFGKYKGCFLHDIPTNYITWCLSNYQNLDFDVGKALNKELNFRINNIYNG